MGQDDSMRQLSSSRNMTDSLAGVSNNQRVRERFWRAAIRVRAITAST